MDEPVSPDPVSSAMSVIEPSLVEVPSGKEVQSGVGGSLQKCCPGKIDRAK